MKRKLMGIIVAAVLLLPTAGMAMPRGGIAGGAWLGTLTHWASNIVRVWMGHSQKTTFDREPAPTTGTTIDPAG